MTDFGLHELRRAPDRIRDDDDDDDDIDEEEEDLEIRRVFQDGGAESGN